MNDLLDEAWRSLQTVQELTAAVGLKYCKLRESAMSVGIGVGFSDTDFAVASIMGGGNESHVVLACGVLRDIDQHEYEALRFCNTQTRDRPAYPSYLHDADFGWDILQVCSFPLQILANSPAFYKAMLQGLPEVAASVRSEAQLILGGTPYRWASDLDRLLLRSTL